MKNVRSYLVSLLIRTVFIAFIITLVNPYMAGLTHTINHAITKDGRAVISVYNPHDYQIWCYIESETYYKDFYVSPKMSSSWYYEPINNYFVECE